MSSGVRMTPPSVQAATIIRPTPARTRRSGCTAIKAEDAVERPVHRLADERAVDERAEHEGGDGDDGEQLEVLAEDVAQPVRLPGHGEGAEPLDVRLGRRRYTEDQGR